MNNTYGIVKTFDEQDFINEFKTYNRMGNFSLEGLSILFESLESLANDCGNSIEMDVIALCCDYSEGSASDIIDNYDIDLSDELFDSKSELVENYLIENTFLCGSYVNDNDETVFIYQVF